MMLGAKEHEIVGVMFLHLAPRYEMVIIVKRETTYYTAETATLPYRALYWIGDWWPCVYHSELIVTVGQSGQQGTINSCLSDVLYPPCRTSGNVRPATAACVVRQCPATILAGLKIECHHLLDHGVGFLKRLVFAEAAREIRDVGCFLTLLPYRAFGRKPFQDYRVTSKTLRRPHAPHHHEWSQARHLSDSCMLSDCDALSCV